jgi:4-hydroxy-tetrahydrodipicolinate reductase
MGRTVASAVASSEDLSLAALFDPGSVGEVIEGASVAGDPGAISVCEVVVEFTNPEVVVENLTVWRSLGVHAVVGTSGFTTDRIERVRSMWGDGPPNCLIVPNFSIGAVLMMRFAELAAPHFAAAEVIELHHDRKADAPSGTAVATAGRIAGAKAEQRRAVESTELVPGTRGGSVDGVSIHSVRLPGLLAHQEVLFGNEGEVLEIRHDTTDRAAFIPGVLLAVRRVAEFPGVTVGLDALL